MRSLDNYWSGLGSSVRTLLNGLQLTWQHLWRARFREPVLPIYNPGYFSKPRKGIATIQYPHEQLPVPDNGRYRLHNEIDDCIVCDKCVKICPVDCITIEPIKSKEEFGRTSDNTPKRIYAAKFDIDMGKCCFCGLCTTVCPTECLTMTKVYDFSVFDIHQHNFSFAEMSDEMIMQKTREWEEFQGSKTTLQADKPASPPSKPVIKPRIKPPGS